ncbi:MAG: GNAT family N-acetyltransferase [Alphaproteobacteria bacterium]|nr:GNAT family N-acetyltransferase [Alphaproteobacteria bacterium]
MRVQARALDEEDLPMLRAALAAAGLPTDDIDQPGREFYAVLDHRGRTIGYGGLERHGAAALLRSIVVPPRERGRGQGSVIVETLEGEAAKRGITALYVLTTDATPFFARIGYASIDRASVPAAIAATSQFTTLCPATATVMRKRIGP